MPPPFASVMIYMYYSFLLTRNLSLDEGGGDDDDGGQVVTSAALGAI